MKRFIKQIQDETDPIVIIGICFFVLLLPLVIGDYSNAQNNLRHHEEQSKSSDINYASIK